MTAKYRELYFEHGFNEQDAYEAQMRGYRSHVWVVFEDDSSHPVTFFDMNRLAQELTAEASEGRAFIAEPGLIVVLEVTMENMEGAARRLAQEGFFERRRLERDP